LYGHDVIPITKPADSPDGLMLLAGRYSRFTGSLRSLSFSLLLVRTLFVNAAV
jgi:hypothetical protein